MCHGEPGNEHCGPPPPGPPPPDALAECQNIDITVTLYDAKTLTQQGSWTWQSDGFMEYGWMVDEHFYVQTTKDSWRIDPVSGPVSTTTPACLIPKTKSSNVSAGGTYIQPTWDLDDPITTTPNSGMPTFGNCSGS